MAASSEEPDNSTISAHQRPIIKPGWPLIFDLIDDPAEEWDWVETRLDCAWVFAPVAQRLGAAAKRALSAYQAGRRVHRAQH